QAPLLSTHTTAAPISTPPLHDALPISVVTAATTAIGATGRLGRRLGTGLVIHTHGQGNPFTGNVHFHHFNLNDITRLHHFARIFDESMGQGGDMYQTVLVYADVHERAEVGHVGDGAFQHHARLQVVQGFHPF